MTGAIAGAIAGARAGAGAIAGSTAGSIAGAGAAPPCLLRSIFSTLERSKDSSRRSSSNSLRLYLIDLLRYFLFLGVIMYYPFIFFLYWLYPILIGST